MTSRTRLLRPSAAMTFSTVPDDDVPIDEAMLPLTRRGKAGQTSNVSLAGVWGVQ